MSRSAISAFVVAVLSIAFLTGIRLRDTIGEGSYVVLIICAAVYSLAIFLHPRLRELSLGLQGAKMTLAELKAVRDEVRKIYGSIENIKRVPLVLNEAKMEELGASTGSLALSDATMRYTVGCMKRERERLAEIFIDQKSGDDLATAILDHTKDELVFKWNGPETPLATPPKSLGQRAAEEEAKKTSESGAD